MNKISAHFTGGLESCDGKRRLELLWKISVSAVNSLSLRLPFTLERIEISKLRFSHKTNIH